MSLLRTEGYAIVSAADGMIADRNRHMPDGLKVPADVQFFNDGLDSAALILHGGHSHEEQGSVSDRRRRLVVTNSVATIADHPHLPNARLWNPAGTSFDEACKVMGVTRRAHFKNGATHEDPCCRDCQSKRSGVSVG